MRPPDHCWGFSQKPFHVQSRIRNPSELLIEDGFSHADAFPDFLVAFENEAGSVNRYVWNDEEATVFLSSMGKP